MKAEIQKNWWICAIILVSALIVVSGVYIAERVKNLPLDFMTEDPLQTSDMPFYTGFISNCGAMLWAGVATIGFIGSFLLWNNKRKRWFFLSTGLWMGYLGADDLFMFHERLLRNNLRLPEKVIFVTYIVIMAAYLLFFAREILKETNYSLLGLSVVFYTISMVIDLYVPYNPVETFVEDSSKFIALAFLFVYFSRTLVKLTKNQYLPATQ